MVFYYNSGFKNDLQIMFFEDSIVIKFLTNMREKENFTSFFDYVDN